MYVEEIGEERNKARKITTDKKNEAESGGKKEGLLLSKQFYDSKRYLNNL